jgi:PhnB protein
MNQPPRLLPTRCEFGIRYNPRVFPSGHVQIAAGMSRSYALELPRVTSTSKSDEVSCAIAPWLSVRDGVQAIDFYKRAFGAIEVYRLDGPPEQGVVARLAIAGAEFWISTDSPEQDTISSSPLGGGSVRLILTVSDPDAIFARALAAGAREVYPVAEGHGWRVGRVEDPFGLHWEIGRMILEP